MKVKFLPDGVEYEIKSNQTILALAQEHGIHIQSVCKGIPSCSECRVNVAEGEYNLLPPNTTELNLIGTAYFVDQRRLSCQLRCFGDVVIDLTGQNEKTKEAVSSKRPRGYGPQKAAGESQAVMGNIIHDEEEQSRADVNERTVNMGLEEEETRRELDRIKSKKNEHQSGNRQRNSQRTSQQGAGQKAQSGTDSEGKSQGRSDGRPQRSSQKNSEKNSKKNTQRNSQRRSRKNPPKKD